MLSAFFFLLTLGAYVRYVRAPSRIGYAIVVVLFALGLLAKSMVVTLPFVLLLLDYWPLRRWQSRNQLLRMLREKTPLFVLSAAACVASAFVPGLLIEASQQLPFPERVGNAVVSAVVYVGQMVCPAGLAALYPIVPRGLSAADIWVALFILTAITVGFVVCRKTRPYLLVGWLWYLGMLVPVLGIVQISYNAAHADRFTYLAQIGLVIAAAWAIGEWSAARKLRKMTLAGLAAAVLVPLAVCGHNQTAFWRDSETLWRHALACTSNNSFAHRELGAALNTKGDKDQAIEQFREALKIQPDFAQAHYDLGVAFYEKGEVDEAILQFKQALESAPHYAKAHNNLGVALRNRGELDAAIEQYRQAAQIRPDIAEFHYNLGVALLKKRVADDN